MADTDAILYPLRLRPRREDKIWGARNLAPYFDTRTEEQPALGEAWLTYEQAVVENGGFRGKTLGSLMESLGPRLLGDAYRERGYKRVSADPALDRGEAPGVYFPILTKLLFTSDVLSVQVHPPDEWALEHAGGPGKTEMWYVIDAEPGARVALGLTEPLARERLAESARTGEIEDYLNWVPVKAGDVIFVPAGLLHTLGPGLKICEIQQNSDLTYRFWDFNRPGADGKPRALHIDEGATVTSAAPWAGAAAPLLLASEDLGRRLLAACPYFAAELLSWSGGLLFRADADRFLILVILEGSGSLAGEAYGPGTTFLIPAHAEPFSVKAASPTRAVCAYEPDLAALRRGLAESGASDEAIGRVVHR
jgi:mannose-6-phosphate isomerase